jgi:hypothetical protein
MSSIGVLVEIFEYTPSTNRLVSAYKTKLVTAPAPAAAIKV